jgi:hypothetical protein
MNPRLFLDLLTMNRAIGRILMEMERSFGLTLN